MLTKDDVLDEILKECDIALHLATKIPEGGLDYRPEEGQRTTLETLRYLSFCAIGGTLAMRDGNWDGYTEWAGKTAELTLEQIPEAMEAQKAALRETIGGFSDEQLQAEATHPLGHTMTLAKALLDIPLKWMVGYRMQLYLWVKAAGNDEIWTPDCWGGVSLPRDTQPAGA
jgi:hypothetical protein